MGASIIEGACTARLTSVTGAARLVWFARWPSRCTTLLGVAKTAHRRRDPQGVSQARAQASSRRQPRRHEAAEDAFKKISARLRGALRRQEARRLRRVRRRRRCRAASIRTRRASTSSWQDDAPAAQHADSSDDGAGRLRLRRVVRPRRARPRSAAATCSATVEIDLRQAIEGTEFAADLPGHGTGARAHPEGRRHRLGDARARQGLARASTAGRPAISSSRPSCARTRYLRRDGLDLHLDAAGHARRGLQRREHRGADVRGPGHAQDPAAHAERREAAAARQGRPAQGRRAAT